jgi:hypothetical protein
VRVDAVNSHDLPRIGYLLLAGVLTGNEFGGWVAVHPALNTLPPSSRLLAEQAVYRRYGRIMPVLMTATLAAAGPTLARLPHPSAAYRVSASSAACYAAMLAITLTRNVPINRQLLALPDTPGGHAELARLRARWDRLHAARNVLNLSGLVLAISGAVHQQPQG